MSTPQIDIAQARNFLQALTGESDPSVTFQTFSDNKTDALPGHDVLAVIRHGTLTQHAPELATLNDQGAGVFAMVNSGDLKGRATENVKAVRAVFIDKDGPLLRQPTLAPSFAVVTSPGKAHFYWRVEGLPPDRFRAIQKRLIAYYGSDPGVHDLCRVMRLPGFLHRKKEPTLVTFVDGPGTLHTEAEILDAHPAPFVLVKAPALPTPRPQTRANATGHERRMQIACDKAESRDWTEGSRHASLKETAAHARKLGGEHADLLSIVGALAVRHGKTLEEAEDIVEWTMTNVVVDPDEVEGPKVYPFPATSIPAEGPLDDETPGAVEAVAEPGTADDDLRPVHIVDVLSEQYDQESWIVPNLLAVGALGIISADYSLGKSTLLAQFLACVASGRDFLGYPVARPVGCLYWQGEGSRRLFAGRVRDQCRNLGLNLDTLNLSFQPRGLDPLPFNSREFAEFVTASGCQLIACDTFGYFWDGDENSSRDWKEKVLKPLKAIGRATGISFFLVHHEGKPAEFRKGRHKMRGTSAMGGDADTVLRLERVPGEPDGRLLMFDKVKDAEEQPSLTLGFDKARALFTRGGIADAAEVAVPKESRSTARQAAKDEAGRKTKEDVALLLRRAAKAGKTAVEIEKAFHIGSAKGAEILGSLYAHGDIRQGKAVRVNAREQERLVDVWQWSDVASDTPNAQTASV